MNNKKLYHSLTLTVNIFDATDVCTASKMTDYTNDVVIDDSYGGMFNKGGISQ